MPDIRVEYIWIDGQEPTKKLRSKTKVVRSKKDIASAQDLPLWRFDGSSTCQATTDKSDLMLKPVELFPDLVRGAPNLLALCEVFTFDDKPHASNTRARLRAVVDKYVLEDSLGGIEQEFTLFDEFGRMPLGWPKDGGNPAPQGNYYCGVGCDEVRGRPLIERHTTVCLESGISLEGTNGEVMPAQWEFQVGTLPPLKLADQLWVARWLLYRLGEDFRISATLKPKPMEQGDWNGAGGHCNFSTRSMRDPGGIKAITAACEKLKARHAEHIKVYGAGNDRRLTGKHETCGIHEFRYGVADRGASIRIPQDVAVKGYGYLEDRRPAANADPYEVLTALLETICGDGFTS
jgi:glutamine synthetase